MYDDRFNKIKVKIKVTSIFGSGIHVCYCNSINLLSHWILETVTYVQQSRNAQYNILK